MPTNDFLPFGSAVGANVMSQADYLALTARLNGFSSGTANSAQLNKAWRQSSIVAAVIGQLIANRSGQNAVDDGTTATLLTNLELAINGLSQIGSGTYAAGGGTANAHTAAFNPPITALTDGMVLKYKASVANTGACTFNPNGLGAKAIVGSAHAALQGGEIIATGDIWLQYNISIGGGSWVLIDSTGGALQVAPATQSQHAMQLGQATGRLIGVQVFTANGTYTPTAGMVTAVIEAQGGGGAGGGLATPSAGNVSLGAPGTSGSYAKGRFTAASIGASQTVTVGAAGAGASNAAGGNGGTSSVGSLITAPGGVGGGLLNNQVPGGSNGNGSAAGTPTGANIVQAIGTCPSLSTSISASSAQSGAGGASLFGGGGIPPVINGGGVTALNYGAGGSGVVAGSGGANAAGGGGKAGIVIIWEYA